MQLCLNFCLFAICTFATLFADSIMAQTLTEKLIAEDPARLIQAARRNGNIVRGAILFHQGNINCVKCHRPSAEQQRIGPDLSKLGAETTDVAIVDSILQPSKVIKKGYESIIATTIDGQFINGLQVSKNDQELVIRDRENVDRLVKIAIQDIDEIKPSTKSNMPDDLVDQLQDRKQFLDLLRYVIDIKERGPSTNAETKITTLQRELEPELEGLVLIQKLNCVACHASESLQSDDVAILAKQAPRLVWSAKWLNPSYMKQFIAGPHATKPGTTMPSMLENLDDAERQQTASAITHFLTSKLANQYRTATLDTEASKRGFELFHSVGCVACHATRNQDGQEKTEFADSMPLGNIASKYSREGLVEFLENPLIVRSSGHMPDMQLDHREAVDIANFLLQANDQQSQRWNVDAEMALLGEAHFVGHRCAACHTEIVKEDNVLKGLKKGEPFDQLQLDSGCLAPDRAAVDAATPNFQLDENEREAIAAAIQKLPTELTPEQRIKVSMRALNCTACHDRNGLGGVASERNPHFKTTNLNLGDQGRIPPTLTGVGAKLNPDWMRDVMVNQRSIRPYMKTRMPQYGESNITRLLKLFPTTDTISKTEFATFENQQETRKTGMGLAGNQGLNCVACHTYKYKISDTMPAVDLTEMAERLQKDWFYQYMLDPQSFSPNTLMPSFWPAGKAIRPDLPGTPEDQVEALWQYLIDGRQANAPRGVVREPLEIVVTDEAKMLRRRYHGIGKRGIGVGYPGGVNIAFDAEQLRLSSVWQGKFVDPGGVWTGQGSGHVNAIGQQINFAKGPELDHLQEPWIVDEGRPPNHRFQGYWLDPQRRPMFRYTFESVAVEDFFSEVRTGEDQSTRLKRKLKLTCSEQKNGLRFRVAEADNITVNSQNKQLFSVGKEIEIFINSLPTATINSDAELQRLEVRFDLQPDQPQEIEIEYRWK